MSEKESPHVTALRNHGKLNRLATERFRLVGGKVEKYGSLAGQDFEAAVAAVDAAEKQARAEADAKLIAAAKPGDMIEGHGLFLGAWTPNDGKGKSLRKTFNVFAAPEDLEGGELAYNEVLKRLKQLRGWHGYDGHGYANDGALIWALENGTYKGGWVIPPIDVWTGCDAEGNITMPDNFFANNGAEAFEPLFNTEGNDWYWSSTVLTRSGNINHINVVHLTDGGDMPVMESTPNLCRPVRLEPVKPKVAP